MIAQGLKKQKLLKRLEGFCKALGDEVRHLDPDLLKRINDASESLRAPAKLAVGGLQNADHRRLAGLLAGAPLGAGQAAATRHWPLIQICHGDAPKTNAFYGEFRRSFDGLTIDAALSHGEPDLIKLEAPSPLLAHAEITLLPFYEQETDRAQYIFNLLNGAEVLIWCSAIDDPWTGKEQRLWFTVPEALQKQSVLALTGASPTAGQETVEQVRRDCERRGGVFHTVAAVDLAAAPATLEADPEAFQASGAEGVFNALSDAVDLAHREVIATAAAVRAEISKIPLGRVQPAPASPQPQPSKPASGAAQTTTPAGAFMVGRAEACLAALDAASDDDFSAFFEAMTTLLEGLEPYLEQLSGADARQAMGAELERAKDLVGLFSYENDPKAAREAADVVRQACVHFWLSLPVAERAARASKRAAREAARSA